MDLNDTWPPFLVWYCPCWGPGFESQKRRLDLG